MNKRTTKFYRKNEEEVMESIGLKPTKNSGAGWVEKEDGQNDYLICQLKSTDAQSIKINQKDIRILERNATVSHKLPVFAIQFLNTGEIWLMAKPEDFTNVAECINTGKTDVDYWVGIEYSIQNDFTGTSKTIISSSVEERKEYHDRRSKEFDKTRSAT